jgi:hypothetical protein
MKIVRDCPPATRLPARHHFALTRLIAFLWPSPREVAVDRLILAIDPHQSAAENYAVSIWLFVTVTCYAASVLPLPLAIPLASIAIQMPFPFLGSILTLAKIENNLKVNTLFFATLMLAASAYFGTLSSPVRFVAWIFFAVVTLNGLAWVAMFLMRDSVRELERQCGL